ncbi:tetratricopeptide repeat protein [Thermospira aquatica]|uniref:Tetratricopeptide repeat protein n=1 Tax=Thermospira aquatica TaxID=2828656 RepID=A0AAX3BBR8_9SPIR|nr:tetratricopeptide repeat protein [Thermospira aquatica]URA09511.1 tetratricopeptide repeat protein [Thermospira aquatica]
MALKEELRKEVERIHQTFIKKRQFSAAIEDLEHLKEQYGMDDVLAYYLGLCYANIGKREEAKRYLGLINKSKQLTLIQQMQTWMLLGYIATEEGNFPVAEEYLKRVIETNPQSSMAYSSLGYVYFEMKRYDQAILHFRKAIQLNPNNAGAHNNLGYTYAELGINLGEAIAECRKALQLSPKSAAYYDSLGWAYYMAEDYENAVIYLQKALDYASPQQKTLITEHLQRAYKKRDQGKR